MKKHSVSLEYSQINNLFGNGAAERFSDKSVCGFIISQGDMFPDKNGGFIMKKLNLKKLAAIAAAAAMTVSFAGCGGSSGSGEAAANGGGYRQICRGNPGEAAADFIRMRWDSD